MFYFLSNNLDIKTEHSPLLISEDITLCIMVTPILDSRTLTGAAFLLGVAITATYAGPK